MSKRLLPILSIGALLISFVPHQAHAASLAEQLKGHILLQVEQHGEAWYVAPNAKRYYLKDGPMAYQVILDQGTYQINNTDLQHYISGKKKPAPVLKGKVLVSKEAVGDAYYVCPKDLSVYSIDSPASAWKIVQTCNLGISNKDIATIPIGASR